MRLVLNLLLVGIAVFLGWMLFGSISEPIAFNDERGVREDAVIEKLKTIRSAQEMYRNISGSFAPNFDTLTQVLTEDSFAIIKIVGDPDDPENIDKIIRDTSYYPAIDSIRTLGINLDSLRYVPFSADRLHKVNGHWELVDENGNLAKFKIDADTMTYQKTFVNVVEVGIVRRNYMGDYGKDHFKRYDQYYRPSRLLKFGDMNSPKLSGNWEN